MRQNDSRPGGRKPRLARLREHMTLGYVISSAMKPRSAFLRCCGRPARRTSFEVACRRFCRIKGKAQLAALPSDEERLILATGRYIGEGVDDARLDTPFLALPVSW